MNKQVKVPCSIGTNWSKRWTIPLDSSSLNTNRAQMLPMLLEINGDDKINNADIIGLMRRADTAEVQDVLAEKLNADPNMKIWVPFMAALRDIPRLFDFSSESLPSPPEVTRVQIQQMLSMREHLQSRLKAIYTQYTVTGDCAGAWLVITLYMNSNDMLKNLLRHTQVRLWLSKSRPEVLGSLLVLAAERAPSEIYAKLLDAMGTKTFSDIDMADANIDAVRRKDSQLLAPPCISVAIETDVGHDCDDLVALLVALSDHKAGRICIKYIATVSRNNVERAKLVQWLCWRMGVSGIPIIPSHREEAATAKGVPLDNSVPLWAYLLDEEQDEYVVDKLAVPHPIPANVPSEDVCKLVTGDSLEARRAILQSSDDVNVLIIGPGVEAAAYHGFERRISRVVWQGYRGDKASFNIGCDHVAYTEMSEWCASAGVTELFVGKSTAYETRLTREQFEQLRDKASDRGLDLQMLLQLGVMEFRDAARNLFNVLNFGIASPSNAVPESMKLMAREYNNQTDAAEWKDVLQMPSTRRAWFAALKSLTPMYDLTAYLLLRDANDLEDKVEREISHPLYRLMPSEGGRVWTVGVNAKDAGIVGDKEAYLSTIVEEILKSLTQ